MVRPARGPAGGYTDGQLVEQIRLVLAATEFLGEGYRKVWAKLRHRGVRTSRARVLSLMREHDLRALSRGGTVRGPRSHEGTIIPAAPDALGN
jgi:putative transposase